MRETNHIVVKKFGGAMLATPENIVRVADSIAQAKQAGEEVVVVVSALQGETDRLLSLVKRVGAPVTSREADVVAATGEQASAGLMALALQRIGLKARSFTGAQVRILTNSSFSDAQIANVEVGSLLQSLSAGEIPVVAGFQGVDASGNVTTLGRGGSDVTAVAVGAALRAKCCHFIKDVEGVFTTDPHLCPSAKKIARLSYAQMFELTSLGAKVLHPRSVRLAERYRLPLQVGNGTRIDGVKDVVESVALTSHLDGKHGHVSIVTHRSRSQVGIEQMMKETLTQARIPILSSFRAKLSASCVVPAPASVDAIRLLHERSLTWIS